MAPAQSPQTQPTAVLEVTGLRIERTGTRILDDVHWRVARGEHWTVLGANGSGKTSLLSALTGYLMPTAGEISVLGRRFGHADWRDLRRHIGLVSSSVRQLMADAEPALETVVSGKYAMIDYWGKVTAADRARALRLLRQIECADLADRPWLYLSQGERQRVLIGRALAQEGRLMLLDEPTSDLDLHYQLETMTTLQRTARERGVGALIAIHDLALASRFSDRLIMLKRGAVYAAGPWPEVVTPANLEAVYGVGALIGEDSGLPYVIPTALAPRL